MANWLAIWPQNFRPLPGEFGTQFQTLATALETAGPALVGTNTTNVFVSTPRKNFYVMGAQVIGANYTNTTTVTVQLFKKSGATETALTAAFDLTAAGATPVSSSGSVDVPITGSDQDCTVAPDETLFLRFIAALTFLPATASPRFVTGISLIS